MTARADETRRSSGVPARSRRCSRWRARARSRTRPRPRLVATLHEASALREEGELRQGREAPARAREDASSGRTRACCARGCCSRTATREGAQRRPPRPRSRSIRPPSCARISTPSSRDSHFERGDLASARRPAQAARGTRRASADYAARLHGRSRARLREGASNPAEALALYARAWRTLAALARGRDRVRARAGARPARSARRRRTSSALRRARGPPARGLPLRHSRCRSTTRCSRARDRQPRRSPRSSARAPTACSRLRRYTEALDGLSRARRRRRRTISTLQILIGALAVALGPARRGDRRAREARALEGRRCSAHARARFWRSCVEDDDPARALAQLRKVEKQTADPTLARAGALVAGVGRSARATSDEARCARLDLLADGPNARRRGAARALLARRGARARPRIRRRKAAGEAQLARARRGGAALVLRHARRRRRVGAPPLEQSFVGPRLARARARRRCGARALLLDGGFPELAQRRARELRRRRHACAREAAPHDGAAAAPDRRSVPRAAADRRTRFGPSLEQRHRPASGATPGSSPGRARSASRSATPTREFGFDPRARLGGHARGERVPAAA